MIQSFNTLFLLLLLCGTCQPFFFLPFPPLLFQHANTQQLNAKVTRVTTKNHLSTTVTVILFQNSAQW